MREYDENAGCEGDLYREIELAYRMSDGFARHLQAEAGRDYQSSRVFDTAPRISEPYAKIKHTREEAEVPNHAYHPGIQVGGVENYHRPDPYGAAEQRDQPSEGFVPTA